MKSTVVDEDGTVRCPNCGAANSFTAQRTKKMKFSFGPGSLVAAPKLRCNGCGTYLKPGGGKPQAVSRQREELPADWLPSGVRERKAEREAQARLPPGGRTSTRHGEWRCEKNDHLLGKNRETCPIDGSPVVFRPKA